MIGACRSEVSYSLWGLLWYGSPVVVLFDRGHPRFTNFYSIVWAAHTIVSVDVVRVKSFDLASVPVSLFNIGRIWGWKECVTIAIFL